jgi:hypothetical protein
MFAHTAGSAHLYSADGLLVHEVMGGSCSRLWKQGLRCLTCRHDRMMALLPMLGLASISQPATGFDSLVLCIA